MTAQLTLLIPRPQPAADRFARAVEEAMPGRWRIRTAPLMQIVPRPGLVGPEAGEVAIFTSANGVEAVGPAPVPGLPARTVGPRTTEAAAAAGYDAVQTGRTVAELMAAILLDPATRRERFVHLHGAHTTAQLAGAFRAQGRPTRDVIAYDQPPCDLPEDLRADLGAGGIDAVTLFSPRTATLFGAQVRDRGLSPATRLLCLSDAVAEAARAFHDGPIRVSSLPDGPAMLRELQAIAGD